MLKMNNKTVTETRIQEDHFYTNPTYRWTTRTEQPFVYDKKEDMHVVLKLNINVCWMLLSFFMQTLPLI